MTGASPKWRFVNAAGCAYRWCSWWARPIIRFSQARSLFLRSRPDPQRPARFPLL